MAKHRDSLHDRNQNKMNLVDIEPLTHNQEKAFDMWQDEEKHLVLHGYAGTGKSFVGLYLGLEDVMDKDCPQRKMIIVRSAVPSRDIGFLPGSATEKASAYEEPYETMVNTLFSRGDAYSILKKQGAIDFRTTSYMRGVTYDRAVILIDEIQNMSGDELHTILTRIGDYSRIILCGDFRQTDLKKEKSGMADTLRILEKIPTVGFVEFQIDDIVRSGFVRDYIIQKEKLGL